MSKRRQLVRVRKLQKLRRLTRSMNRLLRAGRKHGYIPPIPGLKTVAVYVFPNP